MSTVAAGSLWCCLLLPLANPGRKGSLPPRADQYGDPLPAGALLRIGTVRWRVGDACEVSNALTRAGQTLFVGAGDVIRVFDLDSGVLLYTLPGNEGTTKVALSPDGKLLAAAGNKGVVLYDTESRRMVRQWKAGAVYSVIFSPDGKHVITGGEDHDRSLRVFDVAGGKEKFRLLWHQRRVNFLDCTPDGKTLVSGSWDGKILFTNLTTGEEVGTFQCKNGYDSVLALAPDGKTVAIAEMRHQKAISLLDIPTGRELRALVSTSAEWTHGLCFSPDGAILAALCGNSSGADQQIFRLFDVATGHEKRGFPGAAGRFRFSPDGKRLIAVGSVIRVFDVATGQELHAPEGHSASVNSLAFSPDGKLLASCAFSDQAVFVWDAITGKRVKKLAGHEGYLRSVQFTPDGRLVSGGGDSTVRVWDAGAGRESFRFNLHEYNPGGKRLQVLTMRVSSDGKSLSAACMGFEGPRDETARMFAWDLASRKLLGQRETEGSFGFPGLAPHGPVAVHRAGRGLVLTDLITGKELCKLRPARAAEGPQPVNADILEGPFAFSPDGKTLATNSSRQRHEGQRSWQENYAIRLFDADTGDELRRIPADEWRRDIAFSPDGKRLAAAELRAVRIWDAATARELWRSPNLTHGPTSLAFSPDGTRLASGHEDTTMLIWDVAAVK
jgi:WD40 repeat protein